MLIKYEEEKALGEWGLSLQDTLISALYRLFYYVNARKVLENQSHFVAKKRNHKKGELVMKKKSLYAAILVVSFLLIGIQPTLAQDETVDEEQFLDEELQMLPEDPQMPGPIEGTGTYFEVTDSNYLNITLESSEEVHLILESVPEMVIMDIEAAAGAISTQITLTGFLPSTTYYKYEENYHNGVTFTTDVYGTYAYIQDLSQPHLVFIQPHAGTIFIPQDTSIGTWDPVTRTYTLTTDVYETIQIDEDNLTLDGSGHTVTGAGSGHGVYLYGRTDVTVRNMNVQEFTNGIFLRNSSNNTLTDNTSNSNNNRGIYLKLSGSNSLEGNTCNWNNGNGIYLKDYSNNNTVVGNTTSNNWHGITLGDSSGNTLRDNISNSNYRGIHIGHSSNNILTGNSTSNNGHGINLFYSSGNTLRDNTTNSNTVKESWSPVQTATLWKAIPATGTTALEYASNIPAPTTP